MQPVTLLTRPDGKGLQLGIGEIGTVHPREQRQYGDTRMSADHRDIDVLRVQSHAVGHEGVRSAHVEGRDAEELLGVVLPRLLEDLGCDRDGRVDGVADDRCFRSEQRRVRWRLKGKCPRQKIREH
jgi:hypothetical protein